MEVSSTTTETIACRFCRQPVHPEASKCPHCHEQLAVPSRASVFSKKIARWVGIGTTLVSAFYGLKEGYFYIEQRQEQRETFAAHMAAAESFIKLDNLVYAEKSLQQALKLNPNDQSLRLRHFQLRANHILRELDYYDLQLPDEHLAGMPDLITDGFSLIENEFSKSEQAKLLTSLARLLQHDNRWQNPDAINELFAQAYSLAPANAETAYWYGEQLINNEKQQQGLELIQKAIEIEPENAIYIAALGRHQTKAGDYAAAFGSFRQAIELRPKQQQLQSIRASNEAKTSLVRAVRSADNVSDITGDDFFGLGLQQRLDLINFIQEQGYSNRYFKLVAARLYHHTGQSEHAYQLLQDVLGHYDSRTDPQQLTLFAEVLEALGKEEANQVRELLNEIEQRNTYEEILETSIDDGHRYKVGLRVAKQNNGDGIEVLKVFSDYPFAKAGVQPGDRLLEFAHRKVKNLRSIWVPINDFSPGTDVPLKLQRGDELLSLTVVIE